MTATTKYRAIKIKYNNFGFFLYRIKAYIIRQIIMDAITAIK